MGEFGSIIYEVERGRAHITLNRPDKLNAMSLELQTETNEAQAHLNLGLELMGARTLQRLAAENDVRGHNTAAARGYMKSVAEHGLKATLRARDAKFGDGRAKVNGPELRDEQGRLVDD